MHFFFFFGSLGFVLFLFLLFFGGMDYCGFYLLLLLSSFGIPMLHWLSGIMCVLCVFFLVCLLWVFFLWILVVWGVHWLSGSLCRFPGVQCNLGTSVCE